MEYTIFSALSTAILKEAIDALSSCILYVNLVVKLGDVTFPMPDMSIIRGIVSIAYKFSQSPVPLVVALLLYLLFDTSVSLGSTITG